jgi:hypothetical protein
MKTLSGIYKGNRMIEINEDIKIKKNIKVIIIIPEQDDEDLLKAQFQSSAEVTFDKLWNNEEDKVWNEYL